MQIDFLLDWATFEDAVATSSEKHRYFFIRFLIDAAQVCAVFQLKAMNGLPKHLTAPPLCHVHCFHVLPLDAGRGLHQVKCVHPFSGRATGIDTTTEVVRALDFVLIFSTVFLDMPLSSKACMEGYTCYFLNTFAEKEMFHALSL